MDGGDDGTAPLRQLPQRGQQVHGGGAVQSRGGLVCKKA